MSGDERELLPKIEMKQIPGIPGIDMEQIPYVTWHLLNEAMSCYLNGNSFACLASLNACLETYLKNRVGSNENLNRLIKNAVKQAIITDKEAETFHRIRKERNAYLHYLDDKLPMASSARTVRLEERMQGMDISEAIEKYGWEIDPTPTEDHQDYLRLGMLTPYTYMSLNFFIKFFKKRYPFDKNLVGQYLKFNLIEIKGLRSEEIEFIIEYQVSEKTGERKGILDFLKQLFK